MVSEEDAFIARRLQSKCSARFFTHEYACTSEMEYDQGLRSFNPGLDLDITILPVVNPACIGFNPPAGWAPTCLGLISS